MKLVLSFLIVCFCMGAVAFAADTEDVTLTTYYPAPYGEYDHITTNALDITAGGYFAVGDAYLSSGSNLNGSYAHFANNAWFSGTSWTENAAGALIQLADQNTNFYRHNGAGVFTLSMAINSSGNVDIGKGTVSPTLSLSPAVDATTGLTIGQPAMQWFTLDADGDGVFDAGDRGWHVVARGNDYGGSAATPAQIAQQNDLRFFNYTGSSWRHSLTIDGPTGNVYIGDTTLTDRYPYPLKVEAKAADDRFCAIMGVNLDPPSPGLTTRNRHAIYGRNHDNTTRGYLGSSHHTGSEVFNIGVWGWVDETAVGTKKYAGYFSGDVHCGGKLEALAFKATESIQGSNFIATDSGRDAYQYNTSTTYVPDYVFEPDYNLMPLTDLRKYVDENKHLPGILSADELKHQGTASLVEDNYKNLEKIEELLLYIFQLEERLAKLEAKK
ncbi:MAG: hypothetical protein HQ572_05035 [Candidatus Omnitrophica bacterium]|nr:hypothetical protein [Candidatus Omnitrophota bacterium]